jgi:hypothetical protein
MQKWSATKKSQIFGVGVGVGIGVEWETTENNFHFLRFQVSIPIPTPIRKFKECRRFELNSCSLPAIWAQLLSFQRRRFERILPKSKCREKKSEL